MKKRIKEVVYADGTSQFIIQYKILWFWTDMRPAFLTKEDAVNYIKSITSEKVFIHNIS